MTQPNKAITVRIMEREYKIKCPQDKLKDLQEAAKFVDRKMRELRKSGSALSADKAAVLTALNICSEFLILKQQNTGYIELMNQRLQRLQDKIETAMHTEALNQTADISSNVTDALAEEAA